MKPITIEPPIRTHLNLSKTATRPDNSDLRLFIASNCSLLFLVINNLNLLQANIHLIENIKLFTEVNKKIFELIIEKLKSGE